MFWVSSTCSWYKQFWTDGFFLLEHAEPNEAKSLLETYYSPVFHIFYDSFTTTESTLKQKSRFTKHVLKFCILSIFFLYNRPQSTKRGAGCGASLAWKDFATPSWTPSKKMAKTCPNSFIQAAVASCQQHKAEERCHEVIILHSAFIFWIC